MKILHICPTFSQPTCGIATYTRYLVDEFKNLKLQQAVFEGSLLQFRDALLTVQPDVVHFQLEYGFCSPTRLDLISSFCEREGAKFFVTFHTLAHVQHNRVSAHKLSHTDLCKNYGQFTRIKSGIPPVKPKEALPDGVNGTFDYLIFGQAHPHKGILDMLTILKGAPARVLCIVSKPVQGNTAYYDRCQALASSMPNVVWVDRYLDDSEVLAASQACRVALFPYSEYGSIGVSAATKLLMQNEDLTLVGTWCSHFSDIPESVMPRSDSLVGLLDPQLAQSANHGARTKYLRTHSFAACAKEHLELYERTLHS